jgi:hypothetical protein
MTVELPAAKPLTYHAPFEDENDYEDEYDLERQTPNAKRQTPNAIPSLLSRKRFGNTGFLSLGIRYEHRSRQSLLPSESVATPLR